MEIQQPDASQIAEQILEAARQSPNESTLQVRVEHILKSFFEQTGLRYDSEQEVTIVTGGRVDSLFGRIVTEYETPGKLDTASGIKEARQQTKRYIEGLAHQHNEDKSRYVGVILDGYKIGFVRARGTDWAITPPEEVNPHNILLLLQYFRGLSRKPLDPKKLERDFGASSSVTRQCVSEFWKRLDNPSGRTALLYQEWQLIFAQVSGYQVVEIPALRELAKSWQISLNTDAPRFLFAMHTYYALIIKLLTLEMLSFVHPLPGPPQLTSYTEQLAVLSSKDLFLTLKDLEEEGGVFRDHDIANFLEGDFFRWYLDHWDANLARAIHNVLVRFREYEPSTTVLEPERVTDLLKRLYQYLVPKEIRHDLGEFYTPDWLADYVLEQLGYTGSLDIRLLDPNCGSGTFLVRAIKRAKETIIEQGESAADGIQKILQNIVGFDLNPLAVIAARANYLLALGDLAKEMPPNAEIPVYLADSIYYPMVEERSFGQAYVYRLRTSKGPISLEIPREIVDGGQVPRLVSLLEDGIAHSLGDDEFASRLRDEIPDFLPEHTEPLTALIEQLRQLEEQDWNRIWARIIKNRYASVSVGQFDLIAGNPAWVRWSRLPESYREDVKDFCRVYDLFSSDRWVGGVESDVSTLLTYAAADKWLRSGGKLGYLITQTVFKSESAEGFRKFTMPDGTPLKVVRAWDMVAVKPFEGASNRTAMILLEKGKKTKYPIPYEKWTRSTRSYIPQDIDLSEALSRIEIKHLKAKPVYTPGGPWLTAAPKILKKIQRIIATGPTPYRGRKGVTSDLNGVFWLSISETKDNRSLIRNLHDIGRHTVRSFQGWVETDLIYPLARGKDVSAFNWQFGNVYIIMPQDSMDGFDEAMMRSQYPNTYRYLHRYKKQLENRSSYRRYHIRRRAPFYSLWNVGSYTFSPYKVVWREVQSTFQAAVISHHRDNELGRKIVIPDHKLYFVPFRTAKEAHFLSAVLNSSLVEQAVYAYAVETQVGTHVVEYIDIPSFDTSNSDHRALVDFSKKAHKLSGEIQKLGGMAALDAQVAKVFGLD